MGLDHGTKAQRSVLLLLDDFPELLHMYEAVLRGAREFTAIELVAFDDDLKAAKYVSLNADRIVGYVQDMMRPNPYRNEKACAGVSFYNHVICEYTPDAKTLICSGVADRAFGLFGKHLDKITLLPKPFRAPAFIAAVRWILTPSETPIPISDYRRTEGTYETVRLITPAWIQLCKDLTAQPDRLHQLEPRIFERLIAEMFRSQGWQVEMTAQSRDGGYDVIAIRKQSPSNIRILIEAKRWSPDRPISVSIVRSLYGLRASQSFSQVVLATSSYVSLPAKKEFVHVVPWELDFIERDTILITQCSKYFPFD